MLSKSMLLHHSSSEADINRICSDFVTMWPKPRLQFYLRRYFETYVELHYMKYGSTTKWNTFFLCKYKGSDQLLYNPAPKRYCWKFVLV